MSHVGEIVLKVIVCQRNQMDQSEDISLACILYRQFYGSGKPEVKLWMVNKRRNSGDLSSE